MFTNMMRAARLLALAGSASAAAVGLALAQATTRVSVDSQGGEGNSASGAQSLSLDGRFVAFSSYASNLVVDDTNGVYDVFVHDRETGRTTRVSVNSQGGQGNGMSDGPAISPDGRFVAFFSYASNLVADDTNTVADVFLHDRETGRTTRVSVDSHGGQGNDESVAPAVSAGGRFVAFWSRASNLVAGDTNESEDVFVHDQGTGETTLVSVSSEGEPGDDDSKGYLGISADGRFVVFHSWASNLVPDDTNGNADVFVHDRLTGETTRASVDSQGLQGNLGGAFPAITADGRWIAFGSAASNLVAGDTNAVFDVFVHDRLTGETTRVSVDSQGLQGNSDSSLPAISADGRCVAFSSWATNLVPDDTNGWLDIFLHDRETGETTRVSLDSLGRQGNKDSDEPSVSMDGRFVAFESRATNLVPGDTNEWSDAFVHDRAAGPCSFPASWTNYGSGWPGTNGIPGLVATTDPVLCTTVSVAADNSAGVDSSGLLLTGFGSASLPTAWDGTILVRPAMVLNVLVPAAGISLGSPIPCDDSLCGLALFVQIVEIDPGATRGVAFTRGLELRLGVE